MILKSPEPYLEGIGSRPGPVGGVETYIPQPVAILCDYDVMTGWDKG